MTNHSVRISVIVPTFNRAMVLDMTLKHLARQTLPADQFEVVVVDDGSADHTGDVVHAQARSVPFSLHYHRHENRGPGYSQNRGIASARGEWVLILADDMWAVPGFLERHIAAHERYPGRHVAVLGQVRQSADLPATTIHRYWDPFGFDGLQGRRELTCLHFYGCNISLDRTFLIESGGFLERAGAANEDTELGFRLGKHGLRVFYEPQALTYHHHVESVRAICRRGYDQGRNFDVLDAIPRDVLLPFCGLFSVRAGVPYAVRTLPRALARGLIFNRLMVDRFWIPVLERADDNPAARLFASRAAYRGVFGCYCRKGIRDMRRAAATAAQ